MTYFLLIFTTIFCLSNAYPNRNRTIRQTKVNATCHNFLGIVKCGDGSSILPTAKIQLWESDFPWDDLLHTEYLIPSKDLQMAKFAWNGCYNDGTFLGVPFANIEIYYKFTDVCFPGDSYIAKEVEIKRLRKMNVYVLNDGKADLEYFE
uniref:Uncharacterized protein n=1 Tax=Panagrolaimus davidi TaxID=227884 RepID=A0A914PAK0_9BILA